MNTNPTTMIDQSYTAPVVGPFLYLLSPWIFNQQLINQTVGGLGLGIGGSYFRDAAGAPPPGNDLNTDAELAGLGINGTGLRHTADPTFIDISPRPTFPRTSSA